MRVSTGPGKVKDLTPAASEGDGVLSALLFNFDIDDATLKAEHQDFLDENVAPRLNADPLARVSLTGTASRSGTADHDRDLSAQRVGAVRDFLVSEGASAAQITTTFTGRDLSSSANKEDETERAVLVVLQAAAPSPSVVTFTHANPANLADGFDDGRPSFAPQPASSGLLLAFSISGDGSNQPRPPGGFFRPTERVIAGEESEVLLLQAKGMTVTSERDAVAEVTSPAPKTLVTSDAERIRIRGGIVESSIQKGVVQNSTDVVVRDSSGKEFARLTIINMSKIEREISFTFLRDAKGGTSGVASKRNPGDEKAILREANIIYRSQTGIVFKPGGQSGRTLHIPEFDGERVVDVDTTKRRAFEWTKIYPKHRDHNADFNVFFVSTLNNKAGLFRLDGGITEPVRGKGDFRDSIIDDRTLNRLVQSDGIQMAHELGHALGEPHNLQDPTSLMSDNNAVGPFIDLQMAFRMRQNLKDFTQK
jgi:hypothetical protein